MQLTILNMTRDMMKLSSAEVLQADYDTLSNVSARTTYFVQNNLRGLRGLAYPVCSASTYNIQDFIHLDTSAYTFEDYLMWVLPEMPPKPYWKNMFAIFQPHLWLTCYIFLLIITIIYWSILRSIIRWSLVDWFMFFFRSNLGKFSDMAILVAWWTLC